MRKRKASEVGRRRRGGAKRLLPDNVRVAQERSSVTAAARRSRGTLVR